MTIRHYLAWVFALFGIIWFIGMLFAPKAGAGEAVERPAYLVMECDTLELAQKAAVLARNAFHASSPADLDAKLIYLELTLRHLDGCRPASMRFVSFVWASPILPEFGSLDGRKTYRIKAATFDDVSLSPRDPKTRHVIVAEVNWDLLYARAKRKLLAASAIDL